MRYIAIPRTDLSPSTVCLGTASFGSSIPAAEAFTLMDTFVEQGGCFIDTAHNYADWASEEKSLSEKTIGRWLKERKNRGEIVLATKGVSVDLETREPRVNPAELRKDLEGSLRALGVDTIDLYWLHRDDPTRPVHEILQALEQHRSSGKIRYYGCSNWRVDRIGAAMAAARAHGWHGFVASQIQWSLAVQNPNAVGDPTMVSMDDHVHAFHRRHAMAVAAYGSQARGFFSGKYGRSVPDPGTRGGANVIKRYYNERNFRVLERAQQLADELGCTANQIALAFLIHQPFPTFPIVGCRTPAQVVDSCGAAAIELNKMRCAQWMN